MESIKISIISVSFNTGKYLRKSLDSLLGQSLQEIEIIAINNGSTDDSLDILKEYEEKDSRLTYYNMEDTVGVKRNIDIPEYTDYSHAVNYGFSMAKGEYVYILDCDDWLDLSALEMLYNRAKAQDLDVLAFNTVIEYENARMEAEYTEHAKMFRRPTPCEEVVTGKEFISLYSEKGEYIVNVFFQIIKRSFLEDYRISMRYWGGDVLFNFQLYLSANRVSLCQERFHHYLMRETSATGLLKNNGVFHLKKFQMTYFGMLEAFYRFHCTKENDPYIYRVLINVIPYSLQRVPPEMEDLINTSLDMFLGSKSLVLNEPLVSVKNTYLTREHFQEKRKEIPTLAFFGGGTVLQEELAFFKEQQMALPVVICDNNRALHGTEMQGIPVMSLESALETYRDLHFLVTSRDYFPEIISQIALEIGEERIWFYNL